MNFTQKELDTVRVVMARLRLMARAIPYETQATVDCAVLESVLEKMESQTAWWKDVTAVSRGEVVFEWEGWC